MTSHKTRTRTLVEWALSLSYDTLPADVINRTKDFFVDTLACAVAGRDHIAVTAMLEYAKKMGPADGKCEAIGFSDVRTSPAFAALVNGASAHVVEQDDLHNSSVMHPATIIYPTALAVAQDVGASGKEFITACVVGYEFACRAGEYLGKAHYEVFLLPEWLCEVLISGRNSIRRLQPACSVQLQQPRIYSVSTPTSSSLQSVRLGRRLPGCGSFYLTQRTASKFTRGRRARPAFSQLTPLHQDS